MPYIKQQRRGRQGLHGRPAAGGRRHKPQKGPRKTGAGRHKKYIDPSKFTNKASDFKQDPYQAEHTFSDFAFGAELRHNIRAKGYEIPSPIQDQAIKPILDGRDVIGLANTGTGKTAAFLLPIIERQSGLTVRPSVLIMAPTRELAQQIDEQFQEFSKGLAMQSVILVGGVNIDRQIRQLRRRPQVIIGTPGRLKDLLDRRELQLKNMTTLVLDEADRMLDMGFLPDIRKIVSLMPDDRQTLFFSATMTPDIEQVTAQFLNNPVTIQVRSSETSDHVEQDVVEFHDRDHKHELLAGMLSRDEYEKVLVFGDTKFGVQRLSDKLTKEGIPSVAIHGNKSQGQRQRALDDFKKQKVKVLVATDVAARGLDIPNVSHVINFDTPQTYEDYVHRIGRTGRGGARGQAHTFVSKS